MQWCPDGDFLGPAFPASRAQHVTDLHYKFTLGPHHVTKYGRLQSTAAEIRRGKKRKIEITGQKYNGLPYYIGRYFVCFCFANATIASILTSFNSMDRK